MVMANPALWSRIASHPLPFRVTLDDGLEPPEMTRDFATCLRPVGDWTPESARRIEADYRRFLYLKALDGGVLTPPACIDAAWHLHMSFAADYEKFCHDQLERQIVHHEGLRWPERLDAYLRARALYEREFGRPTEDIWPHDGGFKLAMLGNPGLLRRLGLAGVILVIILVALGLGGNVVVAGVVKVLLALIGLPFALLFAALWFNDGPDRVARCG